MTCGFCHIGPNPVNPPADPENPKWANLNSNPGAQYFWVDRVFFWNPRDVQASFVFQLFHTSLPGSLDTSFVSTDNINNPRTMNAVYNVLARLEAGKQFKEKLEKDGSANNKQFNDFEQTKALSVFFEPPDTVFTPHILKDGSDSGVRSVRSIGCLSISACSARNGWSTSGRWSAARKSLRSRSPMQRRTPFIGRRPRLRRPTWRCSSSRPPNPTVSRMHRTAPPI